MTERDFETAFAAFMVEAGKRCDADYMLFAGDFHDPERTKPKLTAMRGGRYIRIVSESPGHRSAWAFVDSTNGDVLKAASWKAPAKNFARGNVYDANHGAGRVLWTGVR